MATAFLLTDDEFERQFATAVLNPEQFSHEGHLRLAFIHLRKYGLLKAILNITAQLRQYTLHLGAAEKYNETLTIAAIKIAGRLMQGSRVKNFAGFLAAFPGLLNHFRELVEQHYSAALLYGEGAKEHFAEPDLLPFDENPAGLLLHIVPYRESFSKQLPEVWERSVKATHSFLKPADFEAIRQLVQTIDFNVPGVYCLTQGVTVLGFLGVAGRKLEMLFLSPELIGTGLGKRMLEFAVCRLKADRVDVNEQNHNAVAFYKRNGFKVYERTTHDEQGNNYPLLRMQL